MGDDNGRAAAGMGKRGGEERRGEEEDRASRGAGEGGGRLGVAGGGNGGTLIYCPRTAEGGRPLGISGRGISWVGSNRGRRRRTIQRPVSPPFSSPHSNRRRRRGGVGRSRRLDTDWAVGRSERNSLGGRGGRTTNASTIQT